MVRAVDMQQVLLQSHSSEKVQQVQQQHPDKQQRYFELQLQEEKKLLREQVKDPEEIERASIRDREEREGRRGARDGNSKGSERSDEAAGDNEEGHRINIRV